MNDFTLLLLMFFFVAADPQGFDNKSVVVAQSGWREEKRQGSLVVVPETGLPRSKINVCTQTRTMVATGRETVAARIVCCLFFWNNGWGDPTQNDC